MDTTNLPQPVTVTLAAPVTHLKAWMTAVGDLLGHPAWGASDLAKRAEVSLWSVRAAQQGRQCGATVAQQLAQVTGLDAAALTQTTGRASTFTFTLPDWVWHMKAERDHQRLEAHQRRMAEVRHQQAWALAQAERQQLERRLGVG